MKTILFITMVCFNIFTICVLLLNAVDAIRLKAIFWSIIYLLCALSIFGIMVIK